MNEVGVINLKNHENKIRSYSDDQLILKTENLVREEREMLTMILHHLREIERRRLFSKLQFTSLFDYAVKKLGYSEDQAGRRIAAMRLLKDLPEIEAKLNSGALTLTHLGLAQTLFRKESKAGVKSFTKEEKIKLLEQIENQPTRAAEKIVMAESSQPEMFISEKVRALSAKLNEVRFVASDELLKKIEQLKGLRAHSKLGLSMADLFGELCDLGLKEWSPAMPRTLRSSKIPDQELFESQGASPAAPRVTGRYIPAAIKRAIWQKAEGKCENCDSTYALEVDHILPFAKGGSKNQTNLRLLCRNCNQRAAIESFGIKKIENFLRL